MKNRKWIILGAAALVVVAVGVTVGVVIASSGNSSTKAGAVVLFDRASSHVPAGKYLQVEEYDGSGKLTESWVIDPVSKKAVRKMQTVGGVGQDVTVFDQSGNTEFNAIMPQSYQSTAGYAKVEEFTDQLVGLRATVTGNGTVDGKTTTRLKYSAKKNGITENAVIDVDPETGLRVREEWTAKANGESSSEVFHRKLIAVTAAVTAELQRSSLKNSVKTTLQSRISEMVKLSYRVLVLKPSYGNYKVLSIAPGPSWKAVTIMYESADNPGLPALAVESWNLAANPDYPKDLLLPLSQAKAEDYAKAGGVLRYKDGGTAIQITTYAGRFHGSASDVAANLVDIKSVAGSMK